MKFLFLLYFFKRKKSHQVENIYLHKPHFHLFIYFFILFLYIFLFFAIFFLFFIHTYNTEEHNDIFFRLFFYLLVDPYTKTRDITQKRKQIFFPIFFFSTTLFSTQLTSQKEDDVLCRIDSHPEDLTTEKKVIQKEKRKRKQFSIRNIFFIIISICSKSLSTLFRNIIQK